MRDARCLGIYSQWYASLFHSLMRITGCDSIRVSLIDQFLYLRSWEGFRFWTTSSSLPIYLSWLSLGSTNSSSLHYRACFSFLLPNKVFASVLSDWLFSSSFFFGILYCFLVLIFFAFLRSFASCRNGAALPPHSDSPFFPYYICYYPFPIPVMILPSVVVAGYLTQSYDYGINSTVSPVGGCYGHPYGLYKHGRLVLFLWRMFFGLLRVILLVLGCLRFLSSRVSTGVSYQHSRVICMLDGSCVSN